jgi:hypothetical protein
MSFMLVSLMNSSEMTEMLSGIFWISMPIFVAVLELVFR